MQRPGGKRQWQVVLVKGGHKRNGGTWDQKGQQGPRVLCQEAQTLGVRVQGEWWGARYPSPRAGGRQEKLAANRGESAVCRPGEELEPRRSCSAQGPTSLGGWP